ncbi:N-acetylglucosamine/diacetylchitobiose ABC transporter substrate-binding protein [Asanoa iriomotensis]|uniref:N-acetylglucosamine/diacetylchitobiose ABC transporter substrate-binding protein n=1 Tax=Asanoa iriomotensis TaxID=234613 RepID=UPI0031D0FF45
MSQLPDSTSDLSRRNLLRGAAGAGLLVIPATGLLSACATGGDDTPDTPAAGGEKSDKNPLGVKEDAQLEVVIFNGGYGEKYATDVHEPLYKKAFPNATIKHSSTQEISTILQPRFAAGDPPDFVNNSGTKLMDFGALVADQQLADLTPLWDAPSVDDPAKKVRDTVVAGTVEVGSFNGKPHVLYYVSTVFGLWYSGKLFKDKGWTVPDNWDAFLTLLGDIKKAGIIPYAYAGKNAPYYQYNVILTHAAKIGGADVLKNIDNLEDGAWKVDAVKQAAEAWGSLIGKGFMDKSHEGLIHTEVQLQQNQNKVALYPSGDWLEGEQAKTTPAGFEYTMATLPGLGSSDKMPAGTLRATAGEGYVVPAKGKNVQGGMEYMRQMLSKEGGRGFTEVVKAPTVVVGASEGYAFPPGVASSQKALASAGANVVNIFFDGWYKDLETEARVATNELMFGRINADQFCERLQKKADATKKDDAVTKFKR